MKRRWTSRGAAPVWLCLLAGAACSDSHRGHKPASEPEPAMQAGSGAATGSEAGGAAGHRGTASGGTQADAPFALDVNITVTLETTDGGAAGGELCAGQCVLLEVVVSGGRPPYEVTWGDAIFTGQGPHRVCPTAGVAYAATATDTPPDDDEFARAPARGSARIALDVKRCDAPEDEPCGRAEFALEPIAKWTWSGGSIWPLPLVGNLTDDNGDGAIDADDTPDVVIVARFPTGSEVQGGDSTLVVLDGRNGDERLRDGNAWDQTTPAIGDLNGDGVPEIVYAQEYDERSGDALTLRPRLAAMRGDGEVLFSVPFTTPANLAVGPLAIALADLDRDGSPEIIAGQEVFDARGTQRWVAGTPADGVGFINSPSAADLDGDGYLEVLTGNEGYYHDGRLRFSNADVTESGGNPSASYHAVADLDGDGAAEIVVVTPFEIFVLDAAGATVKRRAFTSSLACPPTIAALGKDGAPAILFSDGSTLHLLDGQLDVIWSVPGATGCTGSTAFDFAGDGAPEVIFGDADAAHILDARDGSALLHLPSSTGTYLRFQYPVVADVDADGSADLLVVTSDLAGGTTLPALTLFGDPKRRWSAAPRAFNQETYHVTNVNEDGTVPLHETPHWRGPNGFRVQSWHPPKKCEPAL